MKLEKIVEVLEVLSVNGSADMEVNGVAYDSRRVKPGCLFVAVSGHNVDGTEFITEAMSKGAVAVVSENDLDLGVLITHVQVKCARRALASASNIFYGDLSQVMNVIGVTGTNGKTTTTYMIRDLLRAAEMRPGLIGTVSYEIGNRSVPASRTTPEAPEIHAMFREMMDAGCDHVVMEVSSHAVALERIYGIDFKTCVFTNLTRDHLDYHNDMDSYYAVKAKLFEKGGAAIINFDDPWGQKLINRRGALSEITSYGFGEGAMVRATDPSMDLDGASFHVSTPWGEADVKIKLIGRFNIHNALAALAVGGAYGLGLEQMVNALSTIPCVPGRLELVQNRKKRKIFVDYAHTDDALRNVLTTLREICAGKLIVVFGCGGNRDTGKRKLMGEAAKQLADVTIVTTDNPRDEEPEAIAMEIVEGLIGGGTFEVELDRKKAIQRGIKLAGAKDILLVAGKGHETYQEIKGTVVPFDDCEVIREFAG